MEGRGLGVNGNHDNEIGIGNDCIEINSYINDIYYYDFLPYGTTLTTISHTTYWNPMYKKTQNPYNFMNGGLVHAITPTWEESTTPFYYRYIYMKYFYFV